MDFGYLISSSAAGRNWSPLAYLGRSSSSILDTIHNIGQNLCLFAEQIHNTYYYDDEDDEEEDNQRDSYEFFYVDSNDLSNISSISSTLLVHLFPGQTSAEPHHGISDPERVFRIIKSPKKDELCSVCLETLTANKVIMPKHSCEHAFHAKCIYPWIQQHDTCPICRKIFG